MVKSASPTKLISWVDYSLFHSSDLNWIKGSLAVALTVHGWALRIMVEFVPPSGVLYFFVHCGLAVGALMSLVLLGSPLVQEVLDNWSEKTVSVESGFLLGMLILFFTSLTATFQYQPWIFYEIIPTALTIHGIGCYWISRKKRLIEDALPRHFNRIERCNRVEANGSVSRILLVNLKIGDEIKISPSQVVPVDGVVVTGEGYVSESSLNGSSFPKVKQPGDPILAGSVSQDGVFTLKTLSPYVPRKIQSIKNPLLPEDPAECASPFGRILATLLIGLLACLAFGIGLLDQGVYPALVNVSSILIIGTSLIWISGVPVHYWTGLVHLGRRSLSARSPQFVNDLASIDQVFFGKTGVFTSTGLKLEKFFVMPAFQDREDWIMSLVYQTSRMVQHPLVNPLSNVERLIDGQPVVEDLKYKIVSGLGIEVTLTDGLGHRRKLRIGEESFILGCSGEARIKSILEEHDLISGQRIWISLDDRLCAIAKLKEAWNVSPQPFFSRLKSLGVESGILTGDSHFDDSRLEGLHCEQGLTAMGKQLLVEKSKKEGAEVLFVGDGLNDYRAMSIARTSIALRHAPNPLLASASAILASKNLSIIIFSILFCRRIVGLSKRNELYFSIGAGLASLCVIAGWLNPLAAVFYTLGSYLLIWFQSFLLGSSTLSRVENTSQHRVGMKENHQYVSPNRNR
jgi:cation transport ATPase